MDTIRIAAAQTFEYREDVDAALAAALDFAARAEAAGARLLCLPEGFLQGYLTDEPAARRAALDLSSATFAVASRFRGVDLMLVMGVIEVDNGQLFNTAVVIERGALIGRYRKQHLLQGEAIYRPGTAMPRPSRHQACGRCHRWVPALRWSRRRFLHRSHTVRVQCVPCCRWGDRW